ncbi:hypothetical protein FB451DRAFT_1188503 [Mycena latifolia]|nr:hypothetical protein FB451DRAFT_1188503 [Mycena latifolia]
MPRPLPPPVGEMMTFHIHRNDDPLPVVYDPTDDFRPRFPFDPHTFPHIAASTASGPHQQPPLHPNYLIKINDRIKVVIMTEMDIPPPISLQDYLQPGGVPGAAVPVLRPKAAHPAGVPTHGKHLFLDRGAMFADGVVLGTSQSAPPFVNISVALHSPSKCHHSMQSKEQRQKFIDLVIYETNIGEVLATLNHLIRASYHVQVLDEISEAMPELIDFSDDDS